MSGSASTPALPDYRSKTSPATKATRFTTSTWRSSACEAARDAIDKAGGDVVFTARTEGFIHNRPDLDETIRRLKAFADAGADCLYSPGIKTREQIEAIVKAVAPKPINFLNRGAFGYTVNDLAALGVRRISVGGTMARVAMHAFIQSARADRARRQVRQLRGRRNECRTEQVFPRRPAAPTQVVSDPQRHPATGQPIGAPVDDRRGATSRPSDAFGPLWPR